MTHTRARPQTRPHRFKIMQLTQTKAFFYLCAISERVLMLLLLIRISNDKHELHTRIFLFSQNFFCTMNQRSQLDDIQRQRLSIHGHQRFDDGITKGQHQIGR